METETKVPWLVILASVVTPCVVVTAFAFTNFTPQKRMDEAIIAMKSYVDSKFTEAIAHSDWNRQNMEVEFKETTATLREIHDVVKSIEQRTWEDHVGRRK